MTVENKMKEDALRLAELDRLVVRAFMESNFDGLTNFIVEFVNLRKMLKKQLMDLPVIEIQNKKAQEILRRLSVGDKLPSEELIQVLEDRIGDNERLEDLDPGEIEDLGNTLFYSWYSHFEYIEGLNEIGSLVLGIHTPKSMEDFVREAKNCYAFQQYNAMYALCRTIIESSVRDICFKRRLFPKRITNVRYIDEYRWCDLRDKVSSGQLNRQLKDIYRKTSSLIHGRKSVEKEEARDIFIETLKVVHDLYSFHGF